jgi:hypothetical protein
LVCPEAFPDAEVYRVQILLSPLADYVIILATMAREGPINCLQVRVHSL